MDGMKTFGASWDTIGRDCTAAAVALNRPAREHRAFTMIDFDSHNRVRNCGQIRYGIDRVLALVWP